MSNKGNIITYECYVYQNGGDILKREGESKCTAPCEKWYSGRLNSNKDQGFSIVSIDLIKRSDKEWPSLGVDGYLADINTLDTLHMDLNGKSILKTFIIPLETTD